MDGSQLRRSSLLAAAILSIVMTFGAGAGAQTAASAGGSEDGLWAVYDRSLKNAKYIDLTHAFAPVQPVWPGFANATFMPAKAGRKIEGYVEVGEEFTYAKHGFVASAYLLPTDQYGTQLDPPAHWDERGATISDLPPTFAVRPLVVVDISPKVAQDEGYHLQVADIETWEASHGRIPEGAVVMVRSDWSKRWADVARFNQKPFPGVSLAALKLLHLERKILCHGHEPLDTDTTPTLEGEAWLLHNHFTQAEGVANLDQVPESGCVDLYRICQAARRDGRLRPVHRDRARGLAAWRHHRRGTRRAAAAAGGAAASRCRRGDAADPVSRLGKLRRPSCSPATVERRASISVFLPTSGTTLRALPADVVRDGEGAGAPTLSIASNAIVRQN